MWMLEGIAGGIQPWWHHVGAFNEDRRMYGTAAPVMAWHKVNEAYLVNRQPVASVGVIWSQRNTDFYGRDQADRMVDLPYRGVTQALIRARIPYLPIHADYIERSGVPLTLLILPNVAAMSDEECSAVRRFVERGGSLIATGVSSLYNEWGDSRQELAWPTCFARTPRAASLGRRNRRSADGPPRRPTPTFVSRRGCAPESWEASRKPKSSPTAACWSRCAWTAGRRCPSPSFRHFR